MKSQDATQRKPTQCQAVEQVAEALRSGRRTTLLLGGAALRRRGLDAAGRIGAKTGARLACDTFTARLERGAGLVALERIPYFAEQIVDYLKDTELLILIGTKPPVSFFAYPGKPSWCTPETCRILYLAEAHEDGVAALEAVADAIGAPRQPVRAELKRPELPAGPLNVMSAGQAIGHFLPEGAVIAEEAGTAVLGVAFFTANAAPHDYLSLTGGSIGQGLPLATGAAVACPDRKVVCLQGDGGAMYTLQALWTQARERLDVTTVIFANRSYVILNVELKRVGAGERGPKAKSMLDLHDPVLDWVSLARGMGVEASRATTAEEFTAQFSAAMASRGPRLIEAVISR